MIDKHSATWRHVVALASEGLEVAISRIETLGVGPDETENLRGRIAALREILAMADEPEQRTVETGAGYGFQGVDDAKQ